MRTNVNKRVSIWLSIISVIMFVLAMTGFFSGYSNAKADENLISVAQGASIKLDAENTGIRFTVNVKSDLSSLIINDAENDAEVGFAVMPASVLNGFDAQKADGEKDLFDYTRYEKDISGG